MSDLDKIRIKLRKIMNTPCQGCHKEENCHELEDGECLCSRDEDRIIKLIFQRKAGEK